jgi:hypothetical protein
VKTIEYQIKYADGDMEIVSVHARDINSGFGKALKRANERLGNGRRRELHSVAFWMVKS